MSGACHCGKDGHPFGSTACPVHGTQALTRRVADKIAEMIDQGADAWLIAESVMEIAGPERRGT